MIVRTLSAMALLVIWLGAVHGQQASPRPGRKITTTASATVFAKPDSARLTFFVVAEVPKKAREENDKQVAAMKEKLAALSLTNVEIQTVPFSLSTVVLGTDRVAKGAAKALPAKAGPKLQHAQTEFVLVIQEKDTDKLLAMVTQLADAAVQNGATPTGTIDDPLATPSFILAKSGAGLKIQWLRKDAADARRDAIKQAVEEARSNAEAALPGAKLTLESIHVARERAASSLTRAEPTGIDVPVTVDVTVTYSFE